jgi:hypothetical protein
VITHSALVFVDWDSARRISNSGGAASRKRQDIELESAVEALQNEIAGLLQSKDIVRVSWRLYHGWHEGINAVEDRIMFEKYVNKYSARRIGKVNFGRDFAFGDDMLCGSPRLPLRYTVRRRSEDIYEKPSSNIRKEKRGKGKGQKPESVKIMYQKMVDTALVSDLLQSARSRDHDHLIVIGDDDDLIPGIIAAESWGARINLIRINNKSNLPLLSGKSLNFPMCVARRGER